MIACRTQRDWLRFALWPCLAVLLLLAMLYFAMVIDAQWIDGAHSISRAYRSMPEGDYANFWTAGQLARHGALATLYSGDGFEAARRHLFGPGIERLDWLYPPPILLLAVPFSALPLLPGYFLWVGTVFALSCLVLRAAGLSWRVSLLGLLGPATWRAYQLGQIVPLIGAVLFAGLLLSRRRPLAGGALLGLVALKPQIGLLAPLALLAAGAWRVLAVAAAMVLALAAVTTLAFGAGAWGPFLHNAAGNGHRTLLFLFPGGYPSFAASTFWTARAWGASIRGADAAQAATASAAAFTAWRLSAGRRLDPARETALICCLSLLVSPYLFASDLVAYSIGLALLAERRAAAPLLLGFLWVWPGLSDAAAVLGGWKPALPLCAVLAAGCAIWPTGSRRPLPAITT